MEHEQSQERIMQLLEGVETLLDANRVMGEKLRRLEGVGEKLREITEAYEDLKVRYARLEGQLAMRTRSQHGRASEKPSGSAPSGKDKKTKKSQLL